MLHPVYTLFVSLLPIPMHIQLTKDQLRHKPCCNVTEWQHTEVQISTSGSLTFFISDAAFTLSSHFDLWHLDQSTLCFPLTWYFSGVWKMQQTPNFKLDTGSSVTFSQEDLVQALAGGCLFSVQSDTHLTCGRMPKDVCIHARYFSHRAGLIHRAGVPAHKQANSVKEWLMGNLQGQSLSRQSPYLSISSCLTYWTDFEQYWSEKKHFEGTHFWWTTWQTVPWFQLSDKCLK